MWPFGTKTDPRKNPFARLMPKRRHFVNEWAFTGAGEEVNMFAWSWHPCFNKLPGPELSIDGFHRYKVEYRLSEEQIAALLEQKANEAPFVRVAKLIRFPANISGGDVVRLALSKLPGVRPATLHELISFSHQFLDPPKTDDPYNSPGRGCHGMETLRHLSDFDVIALGTEGFSGLMSKSQETGKMAFSVTSAEQLYYSAGTLFLLMYT